MDFAVALKGIKWKRINSKHNNDFDKSMAEIDEIISDKNINLAEFHDYIGIALSQIAALSLNYYGHKIKPPGVII